MTRQVFRLLVTLCVLASATVAAADNLPPDCAPEETNCPSSPTPASTSPPTTFVADEVVFAPVPPPPEHRFTTRMRESITLVDEDGSPLRVTRITRQPRRGAVLLDDDGALTYLPWESGTCREDTFAVVTDVRRLITVVNGLSCEGRVRGVSGSPEAAPADDAEITRHATGEATVVVSTDAFDNTPPATGETGSAFQAFSASELVELINALEDAPGGLRRLPGLHPLVRRRDAHPLRPGAALAGWPEAGYVEVMASAFAASLAAFVTEPQRLAARLPARHAFLRQRLHLSTGYAFAGKVRGVDVEVEGLPEEDKTAWVTLELHALEGVSGATLRLLNELGGRRRLHLREDVAASPGAVLWGSLRLQAGAPAAGERVIRVDWEVVEDLGMRAGDPCGVRLASPGAADRHAYGDYGADAGLCRVDVVVSSSSTFWRVVSVLMVNDADNVDIVNFAADDPAARLELTP